MLIKNVCDGCGTKFEAQDWRHRKYCSKRCKGLYDKSGQFSKGHKWENEIESKRLSAIQQNPSYGMLGKKHTSETIKRMRKAHKFPYNYIDGGYRNKIINQKCEVCGQMNKRIIIHHKDKNRKNNDKLNLLAVCDCCHSHIHFPDGKLGKNIGGG